MKLTKNIPPRITFTRKQLVLIVAEMDGSAPVDPMIDVEYHQLRNENLMGWNRGVGTPMPNPIPPSIRQISYEVLSTFHRIDIMSESKLV